MRDLNTPHPQDSEAWTSVGDPIIEIYSYLFHNGISSAFLLRMTTNPPFLSFKHLAKLPVKLCFYCCLLPIYSCAFKIIYTGSYLLDFLWHREVEDFARRLNSDWPERMQDFLSSGQERTSMLFATNGNGFRRRNTCTLFYLFAIILLIRDTCASWTFKFLFYNCFVLSFSS